MTRHELKDGKWYLIKHARHESLGYSIFSICRYEKYCPGDCEIFEMPKSARDEWVEIEPELAFNLFKDQVKLCETLSGVSSCARGTILDELTDEERVELIGLYCRGCGIKDRSCQCWNDE